MVFNYKCIAAVAQLVHDGAFDLQIVFSEEK